MPVTEVIMVTFVGNEVASIQHDRRLVEAGFNHLIKLYGNGPYKLIGGSKRVRAIYELAGITGLAARIARSNKNWSIDSPRGSRIIHWDRDPSVYKRCDVTVLIGGQAEVRKAVVDHKEQGGTVFEIAYLRGEIQIFDYVLTC